MRPAPAAEDLGRHVELAGARAAASPLVRRLARFGFFCKAFVYTILSALALMAAAGLGGRATDSRGAITTIAREPYGRALVGVLAIGMAALGAWFVIAALADRGGRGRGWTHLVVRFAKAAGGLMYVGLAWWAATLALGGAPGPSSNAITRSLTARALDLPGGRLAVAIAGAVLLVIAFHQARNGWRTFRHPEKQLALHRVGASLRAWAPRLSLVGYAAQALVFALMGAFLLQAAVERDPHEATGFDGALATVAKQPYGMALLGVVALGLLTYALTAAVEARCKRL
ncbi:MAG TPA: DUF1206 domain-containing protein [Anaeromyxobacteraceae bacterium]|nr:DUF1206 domain-containing protein [Anaeromyxobacteraceae bacterium]